LELVDPEIELHDVPEIPGSTVYRGLISHHHGYIDHGEALRAIGAS
jgi:hypothetical protein